MMKDKTHRFLVTGAGSIGRRHLANLLRFDAGPVIVHDPDAQRAKAAGETFQVPWFTDWDRALESGSDTVLICNPTSMHVATALAALRAECNVFLEKPISHSADGLQELHEEAQKKSKLVFTACNFRFERGMQKVRELLASSDFGTAYWAAAEFGNYLPQWRPSQDYRDSYSARRELGGGILLDSYHEFDYLYHLFGAVRSVYCLAKTTGALSIDTEDLAVVTLEFINGTVGEIRLDYLRHPYTRRCMIAGSGGTVEWDFGDHRVRFFDGRQERWNEYPSCEPSGPADEPARINRMYLDEMSHFLRCLDAQADPICSLEEAIYVQSLLLAAKMSAQVARPVAVDSLSLSHSDMPNPSAR